MRTSSSSSKMKVARWVGSQMVKMYPGFVVLTVQDDMDVVATGSHARLLSYVTELVNDARPDAGPDPAAALRPVRERSRSRDTASPADDGAVDGVAAGDTESASRASGSGDAAPGGGHA